MHALQLLQHSLALQLQAIAAHQHIQTPSVVGTGAAHNHSAPQENQPQDVVGSTHDASGGTHDATAAPAKAPVLGAYLWGPVGSGKTLLMDLMLRTLPHVHLPATTSSTSSTISSSTGTGTPGTDTQQVLQVQTQRLHFHSFMLGVHQQLHALQEALPKVIARSRAGLPVYRWVWLTLELQVDWIMIALLLCVTGAIAYKRLLFSLLGRCMSSWIRFLLACLLWPTAAGAFSKLSNSAGCHPLEGHIPAHHAVLTGVALVQVLE